MMDDSSAIFSDVEDRCINVITGKTQMFTLSDWSIVFVGDTLIVDLMPALCR